MKNNAILALYSLSAGLSHTAVAQNLPAVNVASSHLVVAEDLEVTLWAQSPHFYNANNMDIDAHGRM